MLAGSGRFRKLNDRHRLLATVDFGATPTNDLFASGVSSVIIRVAATGAAKEAPYADSALPAIPSLLRQKCSVSAILELSEQQSSFLFPQSRATSDRHAL